MHRSRDPAILQAKKHDLGDGVIGFDPEVMLRNGFCVVEERDVALFEEAAPGVYFGHYFLDSRGRSAVDFCRRALADVFTDASVVVGLTPTEFKAALWMTRHLGFTTSDVVDTPAGEMQLSYLTKKDFLNE